MNREEALERAIELKEHSVKFESVSFLESDTEFFDYVIKELERTAQEVPVQEQLIYQLLTELINNNEEILKVEVIIYRGAQGNGRGNTHTHIILPSE